MATADLPALPPPQNLAEPPTLQPMSWVGVDVGVEPPPPRPPWDSLPAELLARVFSYLDVQDKQSAEETCVWWQTVADDPALWCTQTFCFNDCSSLDPVITWCRLIERKGHYLRDVTLKIEQPFPARAWYMSDGVQRLLAHISLHPDAQHVRSFKVSKLNIFTRWRLFTLSRKSILAALCNFFRSQKSLKVVTLTSCRLSADDGARVLQALKYSLSRYSIEQLDLREFFQVNYRATKGPRFCHLMTSSFLRLRELGVGAQHVDDNFLKRFTQDSTCSKTLRHLRLYLELFRLPARPVSNATWRETRTACPLLTVCVQLDSCFPLSYVRQFLVPELPLDKLYVLWPRSYRRHRDKQRHLSETLDHVTRLYHPTLTCFRLRSLVKSSPELEASVLTLARACRRLAEFKITLKVSPTTAQRLKEELCTRRPPVSVGLFPTSSQLARQRNRPAGS
ncbi:uncharacterized protein LOC101858367 [Aplysia californica]|uniref:Uncharacterized protein LOC101858367 n=1 Tax=Aplysia californica TaxID=6500 RepID=A0ABM0K7R6_APLCA|nr:uncharacterized protein LOC101858367 [Aplysia californica]